MQFGRENNPFLARLENALPVAELTLRTADGADARAIVIAHPSHALGNGMAIGARIAINGRAHPTGNSGERFETLEAPLDSEIHQSLQFRPRLCQNAIAARFEPRRAVAEHKTPKAFVRADQVRAAADA